MRRRPEARFILIPAAVLAAAFALAAWLAPPAAYPPPPRHPLYLRHGSWVPPLQRGWHTAGETMRGMR